MGDLPCYHAYSYSLYPNVDGLQCIAPTKTGQRCRVRIQDVEQTEATNYRTLILSTPTNDPERRADVARYLLLRCCGTAHRKKLDDRPHVLDQLVTRYLPHLRYSPRLPSSPPTLLRHQIREASESPAPLVYDYNGAVRPQYNLRSRGAPPPLHDPTLGPFEPWRLTPAPVVREVLMRCATRGTRGNVTGGWVYAFVWPQHPGNIKVGFTEDSVERRLTNWEKCHPGLREVCRLWVPWAERVEELVHAELHAARHTIRACESCHRTHHEWFRIGEMEVSRVLRGWAEVMKRAPLYSSLGELEVAWVGAVNRVTGELTASGLLDAWDACAEELRLQRLRDEELREQRLHEERLREEARLQAERAERERARERLLRLSRQKKEQEKLQMEAREKEEEIAQLRAEELRMVEGSRRQVEEQEKARAKEREEGAVRPRKSLTKLDLSNAKMDPNTNENQDSQDLLPEHQIATTIATNTSKPRAAAGPSKVAEKEPVASHAGPTRRTRGALKREDSVLGPDCAPVLKEKAGHEIESEDSLLEGFRGFMDLADSLVCIQ